MQDRVPRYPGRVKMTMPDGTSQFVTLERADEPTQAGTPLNKATLLTDATASALNLTQQNPTVNDALMALSQKAPPAEVHVYADSGTTVTMSKDGKTFSAIADSNKQAVFYISNLGVWSVSRTWKGSTKSVSFTVDVIGIVYCYPFTVGRNLDETSWADISTISELGLAKNFFKIGDSKTVEINGKEYLVQIIDYNHDNLTSGNKAGITFQMVDCLYDGSNMEKSNTNLNGWSGCMMRTTYLRTTIWNYLATDLKSAIKTINKKTGSSGLSSTIQTTQDTLFLLSEIEVFGTTEKSWAGEGSQYAYYAAGNSVIKTRGDKTNKVDWWLRSPTKNDGSGFCEARADGIIEGEASSVYNGVSFAFCV